MSNVLWLLVISSVVIVSGCSKQQESVGASVPEAAVQEQATGVAQQAAAVAQEAEVKVQEVSENMLGQVQDLLVKAKELVASGKFTEAIDAAQQVLKIDPNNMDAQGIIETAKAKIAELAQNKAAELKNDLANKLGAFGK